jgi:hypothetical protein
VRPLGEDSVTAANALLALACRYHDRASAIEWICRAFGFDFELSVDQSGMIRAEVHLGDQSGHHFGARRQNSSLQSRVGLETAMENVESTGLSGD